MATEATSARITQFKAFQIMARHPELCCLTLAIIVTAFTKYSGSSKEVWVDQPRPRYFFSHKSPVWDFPGGNLEDVANFLNEEEFVFVMYYAPWDAKCMHIRWEFEKAARFLQKEVRFAAINCWWKSGACRQRNNFVSFPTFFAYQLQRDGYQYHGVQTAEYMVSFLQKLLHPLTPILSATQLVAFTASQDNTVIGFFDFNSSPQPPGYSQFYFASMRVVEKGEDDYVRFGVITRRDLAKSFSIKHMRSAFLVRSLNDTLEYPLTSNFTSRQLTKWISDYKQEPVVKVLSPQGYKSLMLSREVEKGPALMLFTPHKPHAHFNSFYNMLREVALDYLNCDKKPKVHDIIGASSVLRWAGLREYNNMRMVCKQLSQSSSSAGVNPEPHYFSKQCCHSVIYGLTVTDNTFRNICDVCTTYQSRYPFQTLSCGLPVSSSRQLWESEEFSVLNNHCQETRVSYNPNEHISLCCRWKNTLKQTSPYGSQKPKSRRVTDEFVKNSRRRMIQNKCEQFKISRLYGWQCRLDISWLAEDRHNFTNLTGLGCRTNRSVNFYEVDSRYYQSFASNLGLDLNPVNNQTTVVLIDKQNEVQHSMTKVYSKKNIVEFIWNYMESKSGRHFRMMPLPTPQGCHRGGMCIVDVTSMTFHQIVMDNEKDVVLFYHAPWCGFCRGFAHTYLALAKYFKSAKNLLFARINGENNDLPWEFTVERYPTIIFFPAKRKIDSVAFPDHLEKSLPHLIQFVLRNGLQSLKIQTVLGICSETCIASNRDSALQQIAVLRDERLKKESRIDKVERLLKELRRQDGTSAKLIGAYHGLQHQVMQQYMKSLKKRLKRKGFQLKNAQLLYEILKETRGPHIPVDNLLPLMNNYRDIQLDSQYRDSSDVEMGPDKFDIHDEL